MCTEIENHIYFVCDLMWLFQPLGTEYGDRQSGELTGNSAAKALELIASTGGGHVHSCTYL